jgi:hypothetical protein
MKADLVSGILSPSQIRANGLAQLQTVAAELGIDFETLKMKAKSMRRDAAANRPATALG